MKDKIKEWVLQNAHTKNSKVFLFFVSFIEASFFPIPPDLLLIAILLAGAQSWVYYALLTTAGSVLGGVLGYTIGFLFYDAFGEIIVSTYNLENEFVTISSWYERNAFLAVFVSGFTIIPFKLFTIASGLFKVNFITFIVASLLSRGARFLLIAYLIKKLGKQIGDIIYKYFNIVSLLLIIIVIFIITVI